MKLQKRRSGDQYSEQKKSPGRLHTWKNDRKAGGGRTVTSVAAEFGINKSVVSRAWKAFQTTGEKRPTAVAGVIAQQLSTATGRQVSRFTVARRLHKGGLFSRRPERCLQLKVDHRRHRLQWCREPKKTGQLINGVVSSLRMRVGSVPEAILNAF
ncbi:HTH_Tnp_Tc3_2 domain-containing protein [Trichonephila clavipes]|nr:HTH_Tnp_Tc3_2 domain-containing protein [Trichonephila clavipes]